MNSKKSGEQSLIFLLFQMHEVVCISSAQSQSFQHNDSAQ